MAVKVTLAPAQIVVELAATETAGVRVELTVITILADEAVVGEAQVSEDVIWQTTISPLESELLLYVDVPVPTLLPLSVH